MMALIFIILMLAVVAAWLGKRSAALGLFIFSFGLAMANFIHHISTHLLLQL